MKNPEMGRDDPREQKEPLPENESKNPQEDQEPELSDYGLLPEHETIIGLRNDLQNTKRFLANFVVENDFKLYDSKRDKDEQERLKKRYQDYMADIDAKFFSLASFALGEAKLDTTPFRKFEICETIRDGLCDVAEFRGVDVPSKGRVISLIAENLPKLEETELKDGNLAIFDLVTEVGNFGSDKESKIAIDFVVKNLPKIEQFLRSREPHFFGDLVSDIKDAHFESIIRALTVLASYSPKHHDELFGMISRFLKEEDTLKTGAHILGGLLYCGDKQEDYPHNGEERRDIFLMDRYHAEAKCKQVLQNALEFYGVPEEYASDYTKVWTKYHRKRDWVVERNLTSVAKLEGENHGVTQRLTDNFGITEFGRYPESMLFEQDMERDCADRPYGIVLYPKTDWNGAFYHQRKTFEELRKTLKTNPELQSYLIRIFECGGRKDVARVLNNLDKRYGKEHKISFAIIGGHGTKDSVELGEFVEHGHGNRGNTRNKLTPKDLQGSRVHKIGGFFEPGATVILESCSTGQEEGIGQKLSEKFGMKVIAPKEPVGTGHIKPYIRRKDGKIDFDVDYGYGRHNVGAVYEPNPDK